MTGAEYSARLATLDPDGLLAECALRIDYHRRMYDREQWREETRGPYQLCWCECVRRNREDIWRAALDQVRREIREIRENQRPVSLGQKESPQVANLNRVHLIGRLTRDVECRTFANGGKVAQFGFAVTGSRTKQQDGSWKDEPCFLDCKAFNRESGRKLADLCESYLHKGDQTYLEGHLVMESWDDKNGGGKRTALRVVVDDVQFLQPKADGANGRTASSQRATAATAAPDSADEEPGEIPF